MAKRISPILNQADLINQLFEGISGHIYFKNTNFEYISCNLSQALDVGLSSPEQIIGKTDYDFFPKHMADRIRENDKEVLRLGKICFFEEDFFGQSIGNCFYLTQKIPLFHKDKIIGLAGISLNNTVLKLRAEKANFEKEMAEITLAGILENLPGHVYWKNRDSVYQGCNLAQARSAGYLTAAEMIGKTDNEMPWSHEASILRDTDLAVIENKKTFTREEAAQVANSDHISVFLSKKSPLFNAKGEVVGILGISFDITDRKEMEKDLNQAKSAAEAGNKAKSAFIANMSHDIRTPLTGILGLIQELVDTADNMEISLRQSANQSTDLCKEIIKKIQEDGQLLLSSADELLQLLNEILDTMRLESGKVDAKVESFDLRELINHNIELMQPTIRHKKLKLLTEIEESVPQYFSGLRNYLDRSLLNLMSNALKFTGKGYVKIQVAMDECKSVPELGDEVELIISVQDTGIGIPENEFATIFEHFSRLNPSYQGLYKGAGLGLYTVKQYIQAMKGKIKVESEVGKGSSFIIQIPLTVSDHSDYEKLVYRNPAKVRSTQRISSVQKSQESKAEAKISILIVEDNQIAAKAARIGLRHIDSCRSDIAESGQEALRMVQKHHYDLILMDIGLPDIDGIEVTRQIRALKQDFSKIPIVALTGHGDDSKIKEEALAAGMQDVFIKPLQISKLETILKQFIYHPKLDHETTFTEFPIQIIDLKSILQNFNGDEEFVQELLSVFARDLKVTEEKIATAYAARNNEELRAELHKVRGGIAYLVLPELERSLAQFHKAVKEKPQSSEFVEGTYSQLRQAIKNFFEIWKGDIK